MKAASPTLTNWSVGGNHWSSHHPHWFQKASPCWMFLVQLSLLISSLDWQVVAWEISHPWSLDNLHGDAEGSVSFSAAGPLYLRAGFETFLLDHQCWHLGLMMPVFNLYRVSLSIYCLPFCFVWSNWHYYYYYYYHCINFCLNTILKYTLSHK
jgi:hypothetical protein